ncbi:MAG TPA: DUF3365 domain-containing protein [Sediminispirochaeta sp.]|nr:DUF3365 domain-containing protein [Sediminispirochaeta sp.]
MKNGKKIKRVSLIFLLISLFWTSVLTSVAFLGRREVDKANRLLAETAASAFLQQMTMTRSWSASHGGVYVPLTEETPPNPYLRVPERDITSLEGRRFTLVNPANMTREIFDLFNETEGITGKIKSLKPLNPNNAPDDWEEEILRGFEQGIEEASKVVDIEGSQLLRFMVPLETERACLRCHADQGYQVGDIRGGLSLQMPYQTYAESAVGTYGLFLTALLMLGLLGYLGLYASWFATKRLIDNLYANNALLEESSQKNELFRREADHRIKNNLSLIQALINLQILENEEKSPGEEEVLNNQLLGIRRRIEVIASLHNDLHLMSSQTQQVGIKPFLSRIVKNTLHHFFHEEISYREDIDDLTAAPSDAVNYGMILSEMLLNALKHGSLTEADEDLVVSFKENSTGGIELLVSNPLGDKETVAASSSDGGFGSDLLRSLAGALEGKLDMRIEGERFVAVCSFPPRA